MLVCGMRQLSETEFSVLVDTMHKKLEAGPLNLRVVEQPTSNGSRRRRRSRRHHRILTSHHLLTTTNTETVVATTTC